MQNAQLVQRHAVDLRRSDVGNAAMAATSGEDPLHGMCPRAAGSALRCGAPKPAFGGAQIAHPRLVLPVACSLVLGLASAAGSLALAARPRRQLCPRHRASPALLAAPKRLGANRDASLVRPGANIDGSTMLPVRGASCRPPRTAPVWRACANAQGRPGPQFGPAEVDTPDTAVLHGAGVAGNLVQILICRSQTVSKYYSVRARSTAARRRAMPAMK